MDEVRGKEHRLKKWSDAPGTATSARNVGQGRFLSRHVGRDAACGVDAFPTRFWVPEPHDDTSGNATPGPGR